MVQQPSETVAKYIVTFTKDAQIATQCTCTPRGKKIIVTKTCYTNRFRETEGDPKTARLKLESDVHYTTVEGSLFHIFGVWQKKE